MRTTTNRSGGVQGGISNGEPIFFRVAFKPTATIFKPQQTVTTTGEDTELQTHETPRPVRAAARGADGRGDDRARAVRSRAAPARAGRRIDGTHGLHRRRGARGPDDVARLAARDRAAGGEPRRAGARLRRGLVLRQLLHPGAAVDECLPDRILAIIGAVLVGMGVYLAVTIVAGIIFKRTAQQSVGVVKFGFGVSGALLGAVFGVFLVLVCAVAHPAARHDRQSETHPRPLSAGLAAMKHSIEEGATGAIIEKVDPMPAKVYDTLGQVGQLAASPESIERLPRDPRCCSASPRTRSCARWVMTPTCSAADARGRLPFAAAQSEARRGRERSRSLEAASALLISRRRLITRCVRRRNPPAEPCPSHHHRP